VRFLLDANMPRSAADLLERRGHDAVHVRDQIPGHLVILDPRQVRFRPAVER
jgi:predicted nuclease of predicted toxin-antitoxin system